MIDRRSGASAAFSVDASGGLDRRGLGDARPAPDGGSAAIRRHGRHRLPEDSPQRARVSRHANRPFGGGGRGRLRAAGSECGQRAALDFRSGRRRRGSQDDRGDDRLGRFIAQAPVCVAVLCRRTRYYLEDGSAATQNLLNAARAHGPGSCWVAGDKKPYAPAIAALLGAPDDVLLVSLVALGEPAEEPAPSKKSMRDVMRWHHY